MLGIVTFIFQIKMMKQKASHHHEGKNMGIQALEAVVTKVFNNFQESKYCMCSVCLQNFDNKEKGQEFLRQSSSMFKIESKRMKTFYQFLSAIDHKIYFKLQMPELVFFQNGQGKVLFKTKGQAFVMIHLTPEMKKQVPNIFIDSKKTGSSQPQFTDMSINIKYFDSVVPSFKHGLTNDNLENKPTHFTFHSDERQNEDNTLYKGHIHPDTEVAIIKYKDKELELVTEKQLRTILKLNGKACNIQLIQSYTKPHERQSQFIFSEYLDYRKPQNMLMYNRSLVQMKTEIGLISKYSKDYIPMDLLQEYEQMLKDMPEEYCLYQTYKMVHYIQINRDMKVKHLNTVWFKDELKELNFFGVMQFQFQQNQKIVSEINNISQLKDMMKTEMTDLEKQLLKAWDGMKKRKMHEYKIKMDKAPALKQDDELEKIRLECESRKIEKAKKQQNQK